MAISVNFGEIDLEAEYFLPDLKESPTTAVILCHPHPKMGGTMLNSVITAISKNSLLASACTPV